jgi:hypothetical protein
VDSAAAECAAVAADSAAVECTAAVVDAVNRTN